MANRYMQQFLFSFNKMLTWVQGQFTVGSSGAVTALTTTGSGIKSVTHLATGTYQVQLEDNYNRFLNGHITFEDTITGSSVAVTAIVPGTVYIITAVGSTTTAGWVTAGVPVGITPAVGVVFLCAATTTGSGTVKAVAVSGIGTAEFIGAQNTMISPIGLGTGSGGFITFQTLGPTDATHTAQIPVDPLSGTVVRFDFWLRNSGVKGKGE